eukprot:TRINITY_DN1927_c0_g2_i2.p1 TRINITY_DN1927_c0_g2~~TRINITY_DN1927_c0_g2_i2.p1  ORF type:complete len:370 (+),score=67.95 TRINITY_DN1927_c0_g2_i2:63-1172(+)
MDVAGETRQLGLELAETLAKTSHERERLEQENEALRAQLDRKTALLGAAADACGTFRSSLRKVNMHIAQCMGMEGGREAPSATHQDAAPRKGETEAALDSLMQEVQIAVQLAQQLVNSDAAVKMNRLRPPTEQVRALEAKITYLRGKLDNLPVLELENNRLRRVLQSKRGVAATEPPDEPPPAREQYEADPERVRNVSCASPTVIRMPGYEEYAVNGAQWPVRSFGVQCVLLLPPPAGVGGAAHGGYDRSQPRLRTSSPAGMPRMSHSPTGPLREAAARRTSSPGRGISPSALRLPGSSRASPSPARPGTPTRNSLRTNTPPRGTPRARTPTRTPGSPRNLTPTSRARAQAAGRQPKAQAPPMSLLRPT